MGASSPWQKPAPPGEAAATADNEPVTHGTDAPEAGLQEPAKVTLGEESVVIDDIVVTYKAETDDISLVPPRRRLGAHLGKLVGIPPKIDVHALKGVSFSVREGEHVGIVGSNGSGKSTLLRIIGGLETPASGRVLANSTPVLLGVNAALLPALSGAQNVRMGLYALGFTPKEVTEVMPAVIELAGIGDAIHRPMRTYSSGMGARLRFAIATAAQPDILLIDEALGTGDAAFAERSQRAIEALRERAGTVFLVSHAAQTIETMCTRAIWLDQGEILADGDAVEVARAYRWWAWNVATGEQEVADELLAKQRRLLEEQRQRERELFEDSTVRTRQLAVQISHTTEVDRLPRDLGDVSIADLTRDD